MALLLELAYSCFNISGGMGVVVDQWCWPDGRAMLQQPYWLVQTFGLVKQVAAMEIGRQMKGSNG